MDRVAALGQPQRVAPRPAAHVGDDGRRRREVALDDLAACGRTRPGRTGVSEPVTLLAARVVLVDLAVGRHAYPATCANRRPTRSSAPGHPSRGHVQLVGRERLAVEAHAALRDQPPRLAARSGQAVVGEERGHVHRIAVRQVEHGGVVGGPLLLEHAVEAGLGGRGCLRAVPALDEPPGELPLRRVRVGRRRPVGLQAQPVVVGHELVHAAHRLAVHLRRRVADRDVVAERGAHLVDPVRAVDERRRQRHLRLLAVGDLDVAAREQVVLLVGPSELDVGLDRDGVVGLHERVEELRDRDRLARS